MAGIQKYFIESENVGVYEQIFENVNVIDCHTHIGVDLDGHRLNTKQLIQNMNANDVDKALIFPLNDPRAGNTFTFPNERILSAWKLHKSRFVPFFRVNPNFNWKAEFDLRVTQGFRGVKLHPRSQKFGIASPIAMKLYERIEKDDLMLLIHAGFGLNSVAKDLHKITKRFPKLKLIVGHGGFAEIDEVIRLLKDKSNVVFDTSTMRIFDLVTLLKEVSYRKLVFGSDIPYYDQTLSLQMLVDSASIVKHTPNQIRSMLGENMAKWLE